MIDYAHKETDKIIEDLGKSFRKEYAKAYLETSKKLNDYLKGFEKRDAEKRKALEEAKNSDISIDEKRKLEKEYKDWRVNQMLTGDRWKEMLDTMSKDYINANDKARGMVNDKALDVYALNHNYGTYQVETETLLDTSYTLYDRSTVNRLISKNPKMLPEASKRTLDRIKRNKEKVWCQQKLQSAILQGVIQGEPLMKIAGRLRSVSNMTTAQSMRNARTMLTNAQSAGRYDSYRRAKDIGLNIKVVWIATLDQHTRHEHRLLDGQMQDVDEPFLVDGEKIMYPADFGGADYKVPPELIYNCRCTIGAAVPGTKLYEEGLEGIERFSRLEGMSYEEWKGMHEEEAAAEPEHVVVQGRDITATWSRRPDQFDFEIDDVINAQGFDGKPKVVSREEFDEAVKAANDGNGFIAQRAYSAPDQETLDAYRDQLYNGKWYVDCSTGGARHGQGMYCVADYKGEITDRMTSEMDGYARMYGERPAYIETFTVDPSAKFVEENTIRKQMTEHNAKLRKDIYINAISETLENDSVDLMIGKYKKYFGVTIPAEDMALYMRAMQLKNINSEEYTSAVKKESNRIIKKYKLKDHSLVQSMYMNTSVYKDANKKEYKDVGSFAAASGWDGIKVSGRESNDAPYAVILNRTKVIIMEDK